MKKSIPPTSSQKPLTAVGWMPSTLEEANKCIEELRRTVEKQSQRIDNLLEPLDFDIKPGKPTMIIKLGDCGKGWIPGMIYFDEVKKFVKAAGIDRKYNVLVFHYAINTEIRD